MNFARFFEQEVYSIQFECGRCRIFDEPKVLAGPAWLLELQIQLQSKGRRHNLVRILEEAGAISYLPVTLEDVALSFESEVISGAGPWPELRSLLLGALQSGLQSSQVDRYLDLAGLSAGQLETVDQAFTHYPGYIQRVVGLGRRTRARADVRSLEAAVVAWAGAVNEPGRSRSPAG